MDFHPTTIFTCEHAGNDIPDDLKDTFRQHEKILDSHLGWDPGAWNTATLLASGLNAPLFGTFTSRLVVEANRSMDNPQLFSEFTRLFSEEQKNNLLQSYYFPYRNKVEAAICNASKPVLHLSMHSFTPVWKGDIRKVDVGLLFDPARKMETEFCQKLQLSLQTQFPELIVKLNEPYQGIDDGFTTYLRTKFQDATYGGIEIEVNQKFYQSDKTLLIANQLLKALDEVIKNTR